MLSGFIRKSLRSPHSPDRLHPLAHLRSRGAALGGEWGSLGLDSLPWLCYDERGIASGIH